MLKEIYDCLVNMFVVGFIGNFVMNLIEGESKSGRFYVVNVEFFGLNVLDGKFIFGFCVEDVFVVVSGG